jgi:hypothetical protein
MPILPIPQLVIGVIVCAALLGVIIVREFLRED